MAAVQQSETLDMADRRARTSAGSVRTVSVIGSTGSIGTQTLDVVRAEPDRYEVLCLGAYRSADALLAQAKEFRPRYVALADPTHAKTVAAGLPAGTEFLVGPEALAHIAGLADVCVNGVVGFAGLPVTLSALRAGKRLALANKESLITAAPIVEQVRNTPGAEIVPVDSEHGAIHQCLAAHRAAQAAGQPDRLRKLVLTASGGPFRVRAREAGGGLAARTALHGVTRAEALAHPTWAMGPKITVDSSTLMNKGFEVIEAKVLFGVPYSAIEVVVHPQSVVHSMVEFSDGSTIAHLSVPDMRLPIGYALAWPDRIASSFGSIDWTQLSRLDFESPDRVAFPCLDLAYAAGEIGGTAPAWLNAANEVAVEAFLDGRIRWGDIPIVNERSLVSHDGDKPLSVGDILEADHVARQVAARVVNEVGFPASAGTISNSSGEPQ
jgi:1-deoxy-D-xylulose-5-phosphate reductoisomerase